MMRDAAISGPYLRFLPYHIYPIKNNNNCQAKKLKCDHNSGAIFRGGQSLLICNNYSN